LTFFLFIFVLLSSIYLYLFSLAINWLNKIEREHNIDLTLFFLSFFLRFSFFSLFILVTRIRVPVCLLNFYVTTKFSSEYKIWEKVAYLESYNIFIVKFNLALIIRRKKKQKKNRLNDAINFLFFTFFLLLIKQTFLFYSYLFIYNPRLENAYF